MLNSTTLEVAIGMALVYLLLSFFCTAINEGIAGVLGSRAANLEKGIRSLFTEGTMAPGKNADGTPAPALTLADAIYNHGLVQSLYKSGVGKGVAKWYGGGKNLPSYIPSRTFASALFDLLFPNHVATAAPVSAPAAAVGAAPTVDPATKPVTPTPAAPAAAGGLQSMLLALQALPASKGKEAITTLVRQAGGDVAKTRQVFEGWYDDGMDRAAGWYKRKTQLVLFFIGLALAVALNVDSIAVGRALWTSPALRSYAVTAGEQYAKGTGGVAPETEVSKNLSTLQSLALPIGWNHHRYPWLEDNAGQTQGQFDANGLLFAVVGWLLTAVAMTLGAPFWFDTLNQFMVVRSTIKPREKSEIEPSKD